MEGITSETREFTLKAIQTQAPQGSKRFELLYPCCALVGKWLYTIGSNESECLCFDIEAKVWHRMPVPASWNGFHPQCSLVGDHILIFALLPRLSIALFDLVLKSFNEYPIAIHDAPIGALIGAGFTADYIEFKHDFALIGGVTSGARAADVVIVGASTLKTKTATTKGRAPSSRYAHSSCISNRAWEAMVFIFGGEHRRKLYNDLYILRCGLDSYSWSRVSDRNVPAISCSSLSYVSGKLFLYGGYMMSPFKKCSDLRIFEVESGTWYNASKSGKYHLKDEMEGRFGHAAINGPKGLVLLGGKDVPYPWLYTLRAVE